MKHPSTTIPLSLLALALALVSMVAAADDKTTTLDCADPLGTGPAAVHLILGGMYQREASAEELTAASGDLDELVNATTYCRVEAQSPGSASYGDAAADWLALTQWVTRFADLLTATASGSLRVDWREEYVLFAELFEYEL